MMEDVDHLGKQLLPQDVLQNQSQGMADPLSMGSYFDFNTKVVTVTPGRNGVGVPCTHAL